MGLTFMLTLEFILGSEKLEDVAHYLLEAIVHLYFRKTVIPFVLASAMLVHRVETIHPALYRLGDALVAMGLPRGAIKTALRRCYDRTSCTDVAYLYILRLALERQSAFLGLPRRFGRVVKFLKQPSRKRDQTNSSFTQDDRPNQTSEDNEQLNSQSFEGLHSSYTSKELRNSVSKHETIQVNNKKDHAFDVDDADDGRDADDPNDDDDYHHHSRNYISNGNNVEKNMRKNISNHHGRKNDILQPDYEQYKGFAISEEVNIRTSAQVIAIDERETAAWMWTSRLFSDQRVQFLLANGPPPSPIVKSMFRLPLEGINIYDASKNKLGVESAWGFGIRHPGFPSSIAIDLNSISKASIPANEDDDSLCQTSTPWECSCPFTLKDNTPSVSSQASEKSTSDLQNGFSKGNSDHKRTGHSCEDCSDDQTRSGQEQFSVDEENQCAIDPAGVVIKLPPVELTALPEKRSKMLPSASSLNDDEHSQDSTQLYQINGQGFGKSQSQSLLTDVRSESSTCVTASTQSSFVIDSCVPCVGMLTQEAKQILVSVIDMIGDVIKREQAQPVVHRIPSPSPSTPDSGKEVSFSELSSDDWM